MRWSSDEGEARSEGRAQKCFEAPRLQFPNLYGVRSSKGATGCHWVHRYIGPQPKRPLSACTPKVSFRAMVGISPGAQWTVHSTAEAPQQSFSYPPPTAHRRLACDSSTLMEPTGTSVCTVATGKCEVLFEAHFVLRTVLRKAGRLCSPVMAYHYHAYVRFQARPPPSATQNLSPAPPSFT
jgi:hypothetical protein